LPQYDYSQPGAYFVTICVNHRACTLGKIQAGAMVMNTVGHIAVGSWHWLDSTFEATSVDLFCIMPNHVHAILSIHEIGRGGLQTAPTNASEKNQMPKPLGRLIGAYKTHSINLINRRQNTPGEAFWQRNYYERVIRTQRQYEDTWNYIESNPLTWENDEEYQKS